MASIRLSPTQFISMVIIVSVCVKGQQVCNNILDMAVLLDSSGSIGINNWSLMKQFVNDILESTDIGQDRVRVSLTRFSNNADVTFHFNTYDDKQQVIDEVKTLSYIGGTTNTYEGLWFLVNEVFISDRGDRPDAPNLAIVITDGEYSGGSGELKAPAEALKQKARVIAVGITNAIFNDTLIQIATFASDILRVEEFPDLSKLLTDISNIQCSVLTTTTTTTTSRSTTSSFIVTTPQTTTPSRSTSFLRTTRLPTPTTRARSTTTPPFTTTPRTATSLPPTTLPTQVITLTPTTTPRISTTLTFTTLPTKTTTSPLRMTSTRPSSLPTTINRSSTSLSTTTLPKPPQLPTTTPRNTRSSSTKFPVTTIPIIVSAKPTTRITSTTGPSIASTFTTTGRITVTTKMPATITTITSSSTSSNTSAAPTVIFNNKGIIKSTSPQYGPVSGGTMVEITGMYLMPQHYSISLAQLRLNTDNSGAGLPCHILNGDSEILLILTPEYIDVFGPPPKTLVYIVYDNLLQKSIAVSDDFTYRPDPVITSVLDRDTILAGGTLVNVLGESLDSVATPIMVVKMVYSQYLDSGEYITDITEFETVCTVQNATNMKCPTPEIELPQNFQISGRRHRRHIYDDILNVRVKRQNTEENTGTIVNSETLEFYIGFRLDGVVAYKDLRNTTLNDYATISVYTNPEFVLFPGKPPVINFVPNTNQSVTVKGSRLRGGLDIGDYTIYIGQGLCNNLSLQENALSCYPPDKQPPLAVDDTEDDNMPGFVIKIGNFRHKAGYLRYEPKHLNLDFVAIVCATVTGVFFIIAGLITALIGHRFYKFKAAYRQLKQTKTVDNA